MKHLLSTVLLLASFQVLARPTCELTEMLKEGNIVAQRLAPFSPIDLQLSRGNHFFFDLENGYDFTLYEVSEEIANRRRTLSFVAYLRHSSGTTVTAPVKVNSQNPETTLEFNGNGTSQLTLKCKI